MKFLQELNQPKNTLTLSLSKDKDPASFLGSRGITPSIDVSSGTPKWDAQPAIQKVQALTEPYNAIMGKLTEAKDALMGSDDLINLDDIGTQAKKAIDTPLNRGAGSVPAMQANIDAEIADLKTTYGTDKINASQLDEIRKGQWNASTAFKRNPNPNLPFKSDVHFQIGSMARNIEGQILPESEPVLGTLSDHYDAIKNLGKIDGNAVKNGTSGLSKLSNKLVGALIGNSLGGPLGALGGEYVGGKVSDIVNNFVMNNPLKMAVLRSIPEDSMVYEAAQEALQKMEGQAPLASVKNGLLQLPAAGESSVPPINLPSKMINQEAIDAQGANAPRSTFTNIKPTYTEGGGKVSQIFGEPETPKSNYIKSKTTPITAPETAIKPDYGMSHRPTETGATADNISQTNSDMGFPKDFYQHPEYYADMSSKPYQESFAVLKKIQGNPEADVTIYRASPKNELNKGDWVTLSKSYAKGESLQENTAVHSFKVKAKDIQFAGDDMNEFGYYPK